MNQLLKFSFSKIFFLSSALHTVIYISVSSSDTLSLWFHNGLMMRLSGFSQWFLTIPFSSPKYRSCTTLVYCLCLAEDIEFLQHTLKECSQAALLWGIIFENKKQNVIVGFKAHLALVKNSLTQTLPYVSNRGSHISTLGSLDKSLSKALADPAWEDLDGREERYTQILNFSDLEIISFPSHHGRNEKTALCRQITFIIVVISETLYSN